MAGVQLQRSNPPRTFTTDNGRTNSSVCRLCSLGAWGQKRPQNTGVWPLALLGSWVAGMSGPLDTGVKVARLLRRCSRGLSAALRQLQVGVRQLR